jgi:hypothetical protein
MFGIPKATFKKLLLLQVCLLGALFLAIMAFSRGLFSPRELGIAMVILFIAYFISLGLISKKIAKQSAESAIALDDDTRRRILREIWMMKAWIGLLAVSLPIGIVNGVANRAWLPTSVGVAMNVLLTYALLQAIKRWRKRLNWPQG